MVYVYFCRSMRGKICWKEIFVVYLYLEVYFFVIGWSGNIVCGIYEGYVVVVKFVVVCLDCVEVSFFIVFVGMYFCE